MSESLVKSHCESNYEKSVGNSGSNFAYLVGDDAMLGRLGLPRQLLDLFDPARAPDDLHALPGEHAADGGPDAGARPRHHRHAVPPTLHAHLR